MSYSKVDDLLKKSLRTDVEPSPELLNRVKLEMLDAQPTPKRRRAWQPLMTAAIAIALMMVLGTSVYAVVRLLEGRSIAEKKGDEALATAFSEYAIDVYAEQEAGDYRFTLTEMVRGADITDMPFGSSSVDSNRFYFVLAIERLDGTPMESGLLQFNASPLIKGYNPVEYNMFRMNSGGFGVVHEGILYMLQESDDIAVFADVGVKLVVCEDTLFLDAIVYDAQSGDFSLNPNYQNVSALFDLPIPMEYADPDAAASFWERPEDTTPPESSIVPDFSGMMKLEFWDDAVVVEGSRKVVELDASGYYTYSFGNWDEGDYTESVMLQSVLQDMMDEQGSQKIIVSVGNDGTGVYQATCFEMDENGNVYGMLLEKEL